MMHLRPGNFEQQPLPRFDITRHDLPEGRLYETPEGVRYPSVTGVLGRYGDKTELEAWKKAVGEEEANQIANLAARFGTRMHHLMDLYVSGDPAWYFAANSPVHVHSFGYIQECLDRRLGKVYGRELMLWSDRLRAAGTADIIGEWKGRLGSDLSIIDLKNLRSDRTKGPDEIHCHFLQATAYGMMVFERYGLRPTQVVVIVANGNEYPQVYEAPIGRYINEVWDIFTQDSLLND